MARVTSFRSLIALLLAVWMPFCCCSLHTLVSVCQACEEHGGDDAVDVCHGHGSAKEHLAGSHHHDEDSAPGRSDQPKRDHGPCTCDKQKQTTIGVEKITIELPTPVLAYVLPTWDSYALPHLQSVASCCENRAPQRPTTTLLRQHCALIV